MVLYLCNRAPFWKESNSIMYRCATGWSLGVFNLFFSVSRTNGSNFYSRYVYCLVYGTWMMALLWGHALLYLVESLGPSLGLYLNRKKCELFWPSGDQSFYDFPLEIHRSSDGLDLLGSPVCGPDKFFDSYFASKVERTSRAGRVIWKSSGNFVYLL